MAPEPPGATPFRPPSIFSAPLPSGSGARALGLAGSFTALADDATAASWNPAGLIQLQRAEASAVIRYGYERHRHHSNSDHTSVGKNTFDSANLNYLSYAHPFAFKPLKHSAIVSINYHEAYDFTQHFSADFRDRSSLRDAGSSQGNFSEIHVDRFRSRGPIGTTERITDLTFTSVLHSDVATTFDQILHSDLLAALDYDQQGIIYAVTPAFALRLTPRLSVGISVNVFQEGSLAGQSIRSKSTARYEGTSEQLVRSTTTRTTTGTYEFEGTRITKIPGLPDVVTPIAGTGTYTPFSDRENTVRPENLHVEGEFDEVSEFNNLRGYNATVGALLKVNKRLSLGATVEWPWTAKADQKKTTHSTLRTVSADRSRVLEETTSRTTAEKNIALDFPLYWAVGMLLRWSPHVYSTLDVSQTRWSNFSFKAENDPRINPLDGSRHSERPLDDTWAIRTGLEYLIVLDEREIPLRAGMAWEQRPAIDDPDDFYTASLGTGFSIGQGSGRVLFDIAYLFTWARDAAAPASSDITSDVVEHQGFLSAIYHF